MAFGLERIDWKQSWFEGWRELGLSASERVLVGSQVCEAFNALRGSQRYLASLQLGNAPVGSDAASFSVQFIPQAEAAKDIAYEAFIDANQQVPTRNNLHDFFNGLCWLRFPKTKRRLNQLQAQDIAARGINATRGPLRDALTLFDENVLLLQASDAVWQALQERQWHTLCVAMRSAWRDTHALIFGHALLEKLVTPYKSITAHVYRITSDIDGTDDQALDAWLADHLQPDHLATKPYLPLPVLGIPGWWPDNEDPEFYQDARVFRPRTHALFAATQAGKYPSTDK